MGILILMIKAFRVISCNVLIILTLLIVFDVVAYFALPDRFVRLFDSYRQSRADVKFVEGVLYYLGFPQYYFVAHPERGFDIGPNKKNVHRVDDTSFPIWSNGFGCFDENNSDIDGAYYYFTGDSFTWGYAPYETKFATVFEKRHSVKTLKCGVTDTGQRHQFSKFKEIAGSIGHWPKKVIVGYVSNDVANDYAYPHTTVIDGWLVDNIYLDVQLNKIQVKEEWIREIKEKWVREKMENKRANKKRGIKTFLKEFSLSAQIINAAIRETKDLWNDILENSKDNGIRMEPRYIYNGLELYNFDLLRVTQTKNDIYKYSQFSFSASNKTVIKEWSKHAKDNSYELIFMLIPDKDRHADTGFYKELRQFLKANQISFIDLAYEFKKQRLKKNQLYWPDDGHLSPSGNIIVGDIISALIE